MGQGLIEVHLDNGQLGIGKVPLRHPQFKQGLLPVLDLPKVGIDPLANEVFLHKACVDLVDKCVQPFQVVKGTAPKGVIQRTGALRKSAHIAGRIELAITANEAPEKSVLYTAAEAEVAALGGKLKSKSDGAAHRTRIKVPIQG